MSVELATFTGTHDVGGVGVVATDASVDVPDQVLALGDWDVVL